MHALAVLAPLLALLPGGCRRVPQPVVLYDLAADTRLARWVQAEGVRGYLSPPTTVYSMRPRGLRAGAQPRLVSNAILEWSEPAPRQAVLDVERPPWGSGDLRIMLNRSALATLSLRPGRAPYPVPLPRAAQRSGLNRLRLTFPGDPSDTRPPPSGPPVRLHGVSVGSPGGVAPALLAVTGPGPRRASTLILPSGFGLEYALRLPEEAELRFTPRPGEGLRGPVSFRVELTLEGEPTREVFAADLEAGLEPREARVPLPEGAGRPALLGLHVAARPGPGGATGRWEAPRVLGLPEPAPPAAPESSPALEELSTRLARAGVLLIVLDAAAARHFSSYGYERETTPEIDRLAADGILFERAYTPASFTGQAMASLWTSQHPEQHHHGVSPRDRLPEHRVVLAELLREKGIPSAAFIGNAVAAEAGLMRGFADPGPPLVLTVKQPGRASEDSSLDRIVASIGEAGEASFLTYVHYREPHFPYDPPPPFETRFGSGTPAPHAATRSWISSVNQGRTRPTGAEISYLRRLHDGNLAAVDHEIGLLRRRLEAEGRWKDLVVILTADHGESFWEHGYLTHAAQVYEENVRIPLIVKLPGDGGGPKRIGQPVDLLDVGATLADIFGVLSAARPHFEGRSLLPLIVGHPLAPRPLVARTLAERPTFSFFDGRLKLVHDPNWGGSELFDLTRDQAEKRDLSEAHPVTTEVFRQSLYRWLRDLDRGEAAGEGRPLVTPENEEALRQLGYVE